jgi:H+-transporting ATPase
VLGSADLDSLDTVEQLDYMPFDPVLKRTEGTIRDLRTGEVFKVTKGAPHVLEKLVSDHVVHTLVDRDIKTLGEKGIRCLAVAKTNASGEWEMLGMLTFLDPPRPDTKQTIIDARKFHVAVKMMTGDHLLIAKETSTELDLGDEVYNADGLPSLHPQTKKKPANLSRDYGDLCLKADGFAQVYPEHKYLIVERLRELGYKIGMTGDGVNDAPAIKELMLVLQFPVQQMQLGRQQVLY